MEVKDKLTGEIFTVYAIQNDEFLIYDGECFLWQPMEHYEPYKAPIHY